MHRVSILSKIAIIFNLIFIVDLLLRFKWLVNRFLEGPVGLLGGWLLAPIFNLALLFSILLIKRKGQPLPVATWIWVLCLCFLIFQTVLFLFYD